MKRYGRIGPALGRRRSTMDTYAAKPQATTPADDAAEPDALRRAKPPLRMSLRAKGIAAFFAAVAYLIVIGVVISSGSHRLLLMVEELDTLHRHEEMLVQANISVARAILTVNDTYFSDQPAGTVEAVEQAMAAAQASLQGPRMKFPELAGNIAALQTTTQHFRQAPSRADLAVIRSGLHDLVGVLDSITRQEREKKQKLLGSYRIAHDALTLEIVVLAALGVVVLGGISALFFSRLAWDIGKLEERAMDIVMGYRGAPLDLTRGDEVGGLMDALNNMQTELREREKQLELSRQQRFHQEKMAAVGSLAAALAHEINNPIAAIAGIAESIHHVRHSHHCPNQGIVCQPELILEQARRVAGITRQISEFTAPHSPDPALLDLNALVRSTCNFVSYDRRFNRIELKSELDPQLPAINSVGDHLTQVLMNLLINSADAMDGLDREATILVSTRAHGRDVILMVVDNGTGMSAETRLRAFEEFYTTKPVGRGSGLGLALCKNLIESHGGSIRIDSEPGMGTTVTVRLPVDETAKAAA